MVSPDLLKDIEKYLVQHPYIVNSAMELSPYVTEDGNSLEAYIQEEKRPSFSEALFQLINQKGLEETKVYKKAGIDRRHFAKIRADRIGKPYHPGKRTVLSLCLALQVNKDQADTLLQSAGYSLSSSATDDLIITYCLIHKIYDLITVNEILDYFGETVL